MVNNLKLQKKEVNILKTLKKGEQMKNKVLVFSICFLLLFSAGLLCKNTSRAAAENIPTSKKEFTESKNIYHPATRQSLVLFVEDPGQSGFGPAVKPDQQWTHYLDMTVGSGNYGWWGAITDSSDGPPVDTMAHYELVIWNCYDWWWDPCYAPTTTAVANMSTYMDGGGKVWFIGQDSNYSYGPSFLSTFLNPYFEVQSVADDALWDIWNINVQGENVLAGFAWTDSSDYASNGFFSDNVTPTANGQQIVTDGGNHFNVITNDFTASFWTLDGRLCTPDSVFVAVVDSMLKLFGVGAAISEERPVTDGFVFKLSQNSPNPFLEGKTEISYSLENKGDVSLNIYDRMGRLVRTLVDATETAGRKTVYWDGKNNNHKLVSSGTYFYRLASNKMSATRKMVVIR